MSKISEKTVCYLLTEGLACFDGGAIAPESPRAPPLKVVPFQTFPSVYYVIIKTII